MTSGKNRDQLFRSNTSKTADQKRSDGMYENVVIRTAGHLEGKPLMELRKIEKEDFLAFQGAMYGDIRYKKSLPSDTSHHSLKPEMKQPLSPKTSKYSLTDQNKFLRGEGTGPCDSEYVEMRKGCGGEKVSKPPAYYTDIDDSQIQQCIAPVQQLTPRDELSELIYEVPSRLGAQTADCSPGRQVQRSNSFNSMQKKCENVIKPPDKYYQIEDAYLQIDQTKFPKKKPQVKSRWRILSLGKKGDKLRGSSSEQNLAN